MTSTADAVLARTSVACARVATLTSYARQRDRRTPTTVSMSARTDGSVEVALTPTSLAVRQLLARPLASVRVAPAWCQPVKLHGAARRLPGLDPSGRAVFHIAAGAVRVGPEGTPVDADSYATAQPDPLRDDAPAVLRHLNTGHGDALTACLRACGHDTGFVYAAGLDAAGLTVLAVAGTGVTTVRLAFPAPVSRLSDLPPGLGAVLAPSCRCCCSHDHHARGSNVD
jgi:hypothetical protein